MGICPVCNQAVADDFGLVECSKCGAQLIVHVDGTVEYSGASGEGGEPEVAAEPEVAGGAFDFAPPDDIPPHEDMASHEDMAPPEEVAPPPEEPAVYKMSGDSPDLSDLAAFANSADSGSREGPFRYTISITGIDTSDVRLAFREAITDRKFMWDTDQILRSIKQGHVVIANISPGKAYILVNRLRSLPVEVKWEQNAITQP